MSESRTEMLIRIAELEKDVESYRDQRNEWSRRHEIQSKRAETAEAALARVRELPEKWRAEELSARTACPDDPSCMDGDDCANWLDQALQEPEHETIHCI
jgi:hypothetical protein